MKNLCLIPARSGSRRVKDKNIKLLSGKPLIYYTIESAISSKIFDRIIVCTDSIRYASIAKSFGAECKKIRPKNISGSKSPDIDWIKWIFNSYDISLKKKIDNFCILRPTSPFRSTKYIKEAYKKFKANYKSADSLRGVSLSSIHPGKMWVISNNLMSPLLPFNINDIPWHSNQSSILPKVFFQNASIEISKVSNIDNNSITGERILPFVNNNIESFDINTLEDFNYAEYLLKEKIKN